MTVTNMKKNAMLTNYIIVPLVVIALGACVSRTPPVALGVWQVKDDSVRSSLPEIEQKYVRGLIMPLFLEEGKGRFMLRPITWTQSGDTLDVNSPLPTQSLFRKFSTYSRERQVYKMRFRIVGQELALLDANGSEVFRLVNDPTGRLSE